MLATPFRSAKGLAAEIHRKKIGCLELLDLYLSRVGDRACRLLEREYQGFVPPPNYA